MRLVSTIAICLALASPVAAKPPLSQVSEIDDALMMIAIADEIRKSCGDISARMIRAYSMINGLKSRAEAMGYTDDEIDDYVTSKAEKRRMRTKAESYLAGQGVQASSTAQLCSYGKQQISKGTVIGSLLR